MGREGRSLGRKEKWRHGVDRQEWKRAWREKRTPQESKETKDKKRDRKGGYIRKLAYDFPVSYFTSGQQNTREVSGSHQQSVSIGGKGGEERETVGGKRRQDERGWSLGNAHGGSMGYPTFPLWDILVNHRFVP